MSDLPAADPGYGYVDHARLVSDLKDDDPRAILYAYAQVFNSQVGRLVLSHQLAEAGVGSQRGPDLTPAQGRYHDGRADHAQRILEMAGYGRMSVAHLVAADSLEGQDHDRHDTEHGPGGFGGPDTDPVFDPS